MNLTNNDIKRWEDTFNSSNVISVSNQDAVYSTLQNSTGMWPIEGKTIIIFTFSIDVDVRSYQLVFTDIAKRPSSWILYGTNDDDIIPTGRYPTDNQLIAQANLQLQNSFVHFKELDNRTTVEYKNYTGYITDNGETVNAYTLGNNLRHQSFSIKYSEYEPLNLYNISIPDIVVARTYSLDEGDNLVFT